MHHFGAPFLFAREPSDGLGSGFNQERRAEQPDKLRPTRPTLSVGCVHTGVEAFACMNRASKSRSVVHDPHSRAGLSSPIFGFPKSDEVQVKQVAEVATLLGLHSALNHLHDGEYREGDQHQQHTECCKLVAAPC